MINHDEEGFYSVAVEAALSAGEYVLENLGGLSIDEISSKQSSDFVTRVDKESEEIIINVIRHRYPDHSFLAEESVKESTGEYRWIIDPLDGTTNYIHGFPVFSISVALEHQGDIITGVVLDPTRNELFTATKGKGVFLNGKPVYISDITDLASGLISTGFPFRRKDMIEEYLYVFRSIFDKVSDLRRAGSAAIDLAYLAAGRCDGFFEIGLGAWDIAAGSLLVKEAGGIVTDFGGGHNYLATGNIVAGTPVTHEKILKEIQNIFTGILDE
jgi:myo-inositol-1(or 4)-monophosphatase